MSAISAFASARNMARYWSHNCPAKGGSARVVGVRCPWCRQTRTRHFTFGYRKRAVLSKAQQQVVKTAQLTAIREAGIRKLSFRDICSRANCPYNQTTRNVLQELIIERHVEMEGRGRAARYWIRRAR